MKMSRGFQVGTKLVKVWKWACRRRMAAGTQQGIGSSVCRRSKAVIKLWKWSSSLHQRIKVLCPANSNHSDPGYIQLGDVRRKIGASEKVPKGHLAVYVGESKHERHRVMVPVKYLNHPLFGALLEETEIAYGHEHAGGIQIPCPIYKFEKVKMRIAAATHSM